MLLPDYLRCGRWFYRGIISFWTQINIRTFIMEAPVPALPAHKVLRKSEKYCRCIIFRSQSFVPRDGGFLFRRRDPGGCGRGRLWGYPYCFAEHGAVPVYNQPRCGKPSPISVLPEKIWRGLCAHEGLDARGLLIFSEMTVMVTVMVTVMMTNMMIVIMIA